MLTSPVIARMPNGLRRLIGPAGLIWLLLSLPAVAACAGQDLVERFRTEAPVEIEAMFARAHATPNGQGRFWEIRAPDAEPSYLFGTFHSPDAIELVPSAVWDQLSAARTAVFEVDLNQRDAMQRYLLSDLNITSDLDAAPLAVRLPQGSEDDVRTALAARGIPFGLVTQARPWYLMAILGFPPCHFLALRDGAEPLDHVMAERAETNGIPVVGLETVEDTIDALRSIDEAVLWEEIAAAAASNAYAEDVYQTQLALYAAGETQSVMEFVLWLGARLSPAEDHASRSDAIMSELLDRRNAAWIPRLAPHLDSGGAFIAVGALHLPGDAGLVELLRAKGYTLSRLD